jgi:hypothetical protein
MDKPQNHYVSWKKQGSFHVCIYMKVYKRENCNVESRLVIMRAPRVEGGIDWIESIEELKNILLPYCCCTGNFCDSYKSAYNIL